MKQDNRYDHKAVEERWREAWEKARLLLTNITGAQKPFYNLMMFPYPSAEGLHVGNMYAFTGSDIYGRFKRMAGYEVFEPIGLDGFGIHSENYAFKIGTHPMDQAAISQRRFYDQLHKIGAMYDWSRTVETYNPNYYRWTQWLFVQMFKHGLAYRGKAAVNWCSDCKTVLADEQVVEGKCERCGNLVSNRLLEQWFFKITAYAEKLLENLPSLDWSPKVKIVQEKWIGKKEGAKIKFKVQTRLPAGQGSKFKVEDIEVFTTRPDTIFGATFVVLSPNHPLAGKMKEVMNPATKKMIPVLVDEYVLGEVGTGAIMGVPAYDDRDMTFAEKMNLPIVRAKLTDKVFGEKMVIYHLRDWLISRQRYWGPPIPMIYCARCAKEGKSWFTVQNTQKTQTIRSSEDLTVRKSDSPIGRHAEFSEWSEMRGWYPVDERDLPVVLPRIEDYKPGDDGVAPLAKHKEFYETTCPGCGGKAVRETEVSDTFLDSSWYYLRYPSVTVGNPKSQFPNPKQIPASPLGRQNSKSKSLDIGNWSLDIPWDREVTRRWLPVHMYTGGAEHSVLHLLYSRFVTMALKDMGYIDFEEPFTRFYAHGLVIKEGAKMSKSKGNIINPDEYVEHYGVDALRLYLMFMGPFSQGGDFRDASMEGMYRWINRLWRLITAQIPNPKSQIPNKSQIQNSKPVIHRALQKLVKKVTEDTEKRRYNTAIAAMMEFTNLVADEGGALGLDDLKGFIKILAPYAPFLAEELWQLTISNFKFQTRLPAGQVSNFQSVHLQPWPTFDATALTEETVEMVVQVNGKLRDTLQVKSEKCKVQSEVEAAAYASEKVKKHLADQTIKKVIFVPGRLINFVL